MSKYSKLASWVDHEFPRKVAMEYHRRMWKHDKARMARRVRVSDKRCDAGRWCWLPAREGKPETVAGWYAISLRRVGKHKEAEVFLEGQRQVKRNWIKRGLVAKPDPYLYAVHLAKGGEPRAGWIEFSINRRRYERPPCSYRSERAAI